MSDLSIHPAAHGPVHPVRSVASLSHASSSSIRRSEMFDPAPSSDGADRVELSDMARLLAKMRDMPTVRQDRVDHVRSAIDRGLYESDDRLDLAIDKLIQEEDLLG